MEFSRPEYWSGWPFPSPGDLPSPGIEPRSSTLQADSLPAEAPGKPKNTGVGNLIPSPGGLPDPGIEPGSPALQADSLLTELQEGYFQNVWVEERMYLDRACRTEAALRNEILVIFSLSFQLEMK